MPSSCATAYVRGFRGTGDGCWTPYSSVRIYKATVVDLTAPTVIAISMLGDRDVRMMWQTYLTIPLAYALSVVDLPISITIDTLCLPFDLSPDEETKPQVPEKPRIEAPDEPLDTPAPPAPPEAS